MCKVLPVLHALSGCDSTSSLYGIGKKKVLSTFQRNKKDLEALINIGDSADEISSDTFLGAIKFIALQTTDLDKLRYKLFSRKNCESSKLPPTMDSALEHIKRVNYQCYIWKNARIGYHSLPSPVGNGWMNDNTDSIIPKLMNQKPAPDTVLELIVCNCERGCQRRCSCKKALHPCTDGCGYDSNECTNGPSAYCEGDDEDLSN